MNPSPNLRVPSLAEQLRAAMPVAAKWAYFDHAAVAPVSGPAGEAISRWLAEAVSQGDADWPAWARGIEQTRQHAAAMIGASAAEIALVTSTTMGINYVAEGLDWRPGDNVVVLADEFPSNMYPWLHQESKGVEVRAVPTDRGRVNLEDVRAACDARTRLVSASWVQYAAGYRQDVAALCDIAHSAGALFFLDAIQGLGVFPLDVRETPIDFLAADGHKWLLGPEGAGVFYCREELLDQLRPIGVGWGSVVGAHDFSKIDLTFKPSAARYEGGSCNMPGLLALGASLELLSRWPRAAIASAVLEITDLACERLRSIGAEIVSHRALEPNGHDPRSGIVAFTLPGRDPLALRQQALNAGVTLSCRSGRLRLSAHAYNDAADVERLIAALA